MFIYNNSMYVHLHEYMQLLVGYLEGWRELPNDDFDNGLLAIQGAWQVTAVDLRVKRNLTTYS